MGRAWTTKGVVVVVDPCFEEGVMMKVASGENKSFCTEDIADATHFSTSGIHEGKQRGKEIRDAYYFGKFIFLEIFSELHLG